MMKEQMKKHFGNLIESAVGLPAALIRWVKNIGKEVKLICNAFTPSTHQRVITRFTSVAITTRYLLGKSDGTATGVTVCTTGDRALYVITDTAATSSDLALTSPQAVACEFLEGTDRSLPMIAAGAIAVGSIVYPVANGQVNTYVGLGSTGTNYACGVVIANASAQAGDILEVMAFFSPALSTT